MKRFRNWILFFFLIFSIRTNAQDSTSYLTIKQCVDLAIKNNLQIQQSEITLEQNGVAFKQAKDNLLPQINGTIQQQNNYGRSISNVNNAYVDLQNGSGNYSLNGSLTLFSGLTLINSIKANALNYNASKMDLQQQKDNITLNVILTYLIVLSNQEQLDIARHQSEVDLRQVERLQIQNQEGAIAPATLYDLKGQYANDQVNVVTALNALEISKVNLFAVLNVPYQKDAHYEMVSMNADILDLQTPSDSVFQRALQIIPNIKANDLRVQSYDKYISVYKGRMWPTLSLYGNLNSNYSSIATTGLPGTGTPQGTGGYVTVAGSQYDVFANSLATQKTAFADQVKNNRFQSVGLQLSIPILNFFTARNNVKVARLNYLNAKVLSNASRNQLQHK